MTTAAIPAEAFAHGDPRRYWRGCRCTNCSKAASRQSARNKLLRTTGRGDIMPPHKAARHIHALRLTGMPDAEIMQAAAITVSTFYRIAGRTGSIRRNVEQRVLAVQAAPRPLAENCSRIDGTGTRRRLQALVAAGWPCNAIAARLGTDDKYTHELLTGDGRNVMLRTAAKINDLFAELCGQQPEAHGIRPVSAARARNLAKRRSWHPAGAWDDIDDPAEQPNYGAWSSRDAALVEDTAELARQGCNREQIAERLGATWSYITTAHSRSRTPLPEVTT